MKKQKLCLILLSLSSLSILVNACAVIPKHYVRPGADITGVKAVAVLPFENFTSDEFANEKVRRSVIIEFLRRGIDVVEPGEVLRVLNELKVKSLGSIQVDDIRNIGKKLDVQAVIMGSVETFRMSKGISVTYPEVSVSLRLLESLSGNTAWSVSHTSGGASFWTRHFGAEGSALDETAGKVVKEALDTLFFSRTQQPLDEETEYLWAR